MMLNEERERADKALRLNGFTDNPANNKMLLEQNQR